MTQDKQEAEAQLSMDQPPKYRGRLGVRHVQVLVLFLAMMVNYLMRINLSIGIVLMTDLNSTSEQRVFDWSPKERSAALSSFFFGYLIMNLVAAVLVTKFNNKTLLLISVGLSSCLTLLTPTLVNLWDFPALLAIRAILGLMQGFLMPVVLGQLSRWIPPAERARCGTLVLGGLHFGTIVSFASSGVLGDKAGGWPSVFYFSGGLGALWILAWMFLGTESPNSCPYISDEERDYIEEQLMESTSRPKNARLPWKEMLKNKACIAVAIVSLTHNWGYWTLITQMPTYFKGVLHFSSTQNGLISAIPYTCLWIVSFPSSIIVDKLITKGVTSVTFSRKMCNTLAHWGAAAALIVLGFTKTADLVIVVYTVGITLIGFIFMGFNINHLDIVPNFAGLLMGFTNGLANITAILGPLYVGYAVPDTSDEVQWRMVFFVSAAIFFFGNLAFIIMGSGEVQELNHLGGERLPQDDPDQIYHYKKKLSVPSIF